MAQVTTFLVTAIRWMLFPINCKNKSNQDPDTISTWLRSDNSVPCTPWGSVEVAVTLLSLFLAAIFVLFSLIANLLSFEVSPISQVPGDAFTGRIEALWTIARVAAATMVYIQVPFY